MKLEPVKKRLYIHDNVLMLVRISLYMFKYSNMSLCLAAT